MFRFYYSLFFVLIVLAPVPAQAVTCGDGIVEWAENCDDGNTVDGDGCSSSCRLEEEPLSCSGHHDCLQGEFCHRGTCRFDDLPIFHCGKSGCPPGQFCVETDGSRSICAEDPNYICTDASACGPAHACIEVPGISIAKTCVKDPDDLWISGDNIYGIDIPVGEPTYTCNSPECIVGLLANGGRALCIDRDDGDIRDECGGVQCYAARDCEPGEQCVDTRVAAPSTPPGTMCNQEGGFCISSALAEGVFDWTPSQLLDACEIASFADESCDAGWKPGGVVAIERVVGLPLTVFGAEGSCGNTVCEAWETAVNCGSDCGCGDGWCDTTEVGTCTVDCGICGDGACGRLETAKTCAADCPVTCGDGSCDASEVSTCAEDCVCGAETVSFDDKPAFCGDGVCQSSGVLAENCLTCARDCGAPTDVDGDTVPHCVDNCPLQSNVDQADFDGDEVGDACDPDVDGDDVANSADKCASTSVPLGTVVYASCDSGVADFMIPDEPGCSVTQQIERLATDARSYGQLVARVDKLLVSLQKQGLLQAQDKDPIKVCVAQ